MRISLKFERNNKKSMARTFFWDFQNSYRILEILQKIRQFWRFLGQRGPQKSPKNWREKISSKKFWASLKIFYRNLRQNTQNRRFSDFVGTGHCKFLVVFWRSQNFGFHRFIVVFLAKAKNLVVFVVFWLRQNPRFSWPPLAAPAENPTEFVIFQPPKLTKIEDFVNFEGFLFSNFSEFFQKIFDFFENFKKNSLRRSKNFGFLKFQIFSRNLRFRSKNPKFPSKLAVGQTSQNCVFWQIPIQNLWFWDFRFKNC